MLKHKNIICISSIDWDFVWQTHQEVMDTFARHGNRVLYIENTGIRVPAVSDLPRIRKRLINWFRSFKGIRKEKENLFIYSPVILPFPYSRIAAFINRNIMLPMLKKWMKAAGFANPIIWTFLPTKTALDLIKNIDNELSIYHCVANFDELVRDKAKMQKSEKQILKNVDLVFAQGAILKKRCEQYNKNVAIFPCGVRESMFKKPEASRREKTVCPSDLEGIKGIKVGYIGGVHKHIDYELLEYIARERPEWSVVLIGPDQVNYSHRKKPKNVIMLGMKKYEELPDYIENMDLCVIPYKINEYTKTVYPSKINEYLLMGKAVVSTALPEIEEFNRTHGSVVYIAGSREDFLKLSEKAMASSDSGEISKRKEAAMANTWESRIKKMSDIIEKKINENAACSGRGWKENLTRIYRVSKKKMLKTAAAVILSYFIIFYSPLVWFLAEPLKISQSPEKVDAILVFGGGVGETGSPGKSTTERARLSVELYKRGFSQRIIYSAGFTYKYNDAEEMKRFAVSMGVPGKDIILEKEGNTAYENVKQSNEILRKKGLHKIILISSPYNMRRVALVFNHIANDIEVIYVPVPGPQFYHRARFVKLEQIGAIVHEYLGIAYYYLKGYIR